MLRKGLVCIPLLLTGCVAPLAVGGISAVGSTAVEDRGLEGYASDQALRVKLNFELSNKLCDFAGIELTVYKGRVLLTGSAASEQIKQDALRITKSTAGVKQVIDGMNVEGEDGFVEYTRDMWLTTRLKTALYADHDVEAPNYLVHTFDKVIYIFGTAQNQEEMQTVLAHAYEMTGIRKVVNLIEVCGVPQHNP